MVGSKTAGSFHHRNLAPAGGVVRGQLLLDVTLYMLNTYGCLEDRNLKKLTDNLKVRAYWSEMGTDDMIHEW